MTDPSLADTPVSHAASRQTLAPLSRLNLNVGNRSARELVRLVDEGFLSLDPPYQRGAVWTEDQQVALIRSFLEGVPIPAVVMNNRFHNGWTDLSVPNPGTESAGYVMVDGKQRIRAVKDFIDGRFAVPASWFDPEFVELTEDTADGPYVRHPGLTEVGRRVLANRMLIPVAEGVLGSVAAEADLYLLVNGGGTPHTAADLSRALGLSSKTVTPTAADHG